MKCDLVYFIHRRTIWTRHPVLSHGSSGLDLPCAPSSGSSLRSAPSSPSRLSGWSVQFWYLNLSWISVYLNSSFFSFLSVILTPQVVVIMGLVLQWANLYGYVRCKVGGKSSLRNMAKNYLGVHILKQVCEQQLCFLITFFS